MTRSPATNGTNGTNGNGKYVLVGTCASVIAVALGIIAYIGSLSIGPLVTDIKELKEWRAKDQAEFKALAVLTTERGGAIFKNAENIHRMDDEILRIRGQIVSREEHTGKDALFTKDVVSLQRQIDDLTKQFGGLYPLGKVLDDLQRRIDRIQAVQQQPPSH